MRIFISLDVLMEDDYFLRHAQIRMVVALDLANCQVQMPWV